MKPTVRVIGLVCTLFALAAASAFAQKVPSRADAPDPATHVDVQKIDPDEFSNWWSQFKSQFDEGVYPDLLHQVNVPVDAIPIP